MRQKNARAIKNLFGLILLATSVATGNHHSLGQNTGGQNTGQAQGNQQSVDVNDVLVKDSGRIVVEFEAPSRSGHRSPGGVESPTLVVNGYEFAVYGKMKIYGELKKGVLDDADKIKIRLKICLSHVMNQKDPEVSQRLQADQKYDWEYWKVDELPGEGDANESVQGSNPRGKAEQNDENFKRDSTVLAEIAPNKNGQKPVIQSEDHDVLLEVDKNAEKIDVEVRFKLIWVAKNLEVANVYKFHVTGPVPVQNQHVGVIVVAAEDVTNPAYVKKTVYRLLVLSGWNPDPFLWLKD